ncbi:MAG: undecaprenyl-diphosphate phosphatase [Propionibacteriales bacterium]|nr:undecaprenyl-diphosphate phosphatase [Propionibacteriales bacterium]
MDWWHAILLGIVEGITEFLPISSTGHLTVAEKLLGLNVSDPGVTAFTAIIQVGAMIASIIYFWSDIVRFATAWFGGLFNADKRKESDYKMGWAIIVGFAITGSIAFALRHLVEGPLRSLWAVAIGLIAWSIVMFIADRVAERQVPTGTRAIGGGARDESTITWVDGAIIGLVQVVSLVPGVSRSGATISAGMLRGIDRVSATRMSFFLGIPTLVAAGSWEAASAAGDIGAGVGWVSTGIGTVVSGVVAYFSIAWLLKFVAHNNFTGFIIYRVLLGVAIIALLLTGTISAV